MMMEDESESGIDCPKCGAHLEVSAEAMLPQQTDMTLSLQIEEGQLMQLETLGGVLTNFAELQKAVGKQVGVAVTVLLAGLQYENDRLDKTARICNEVTSPND